MTYLKLTLEKIFEYILKVDISRYILKRNVLLPVVIALLIIWLIYRIKNQIKLSVTKEINNYVPSIIRNVEGLELRFNYLNNLAQDIEKKLKEVESKTKNYTDVNGDAK